MKTLRYDGPRNKSLTIGGSGFASASLALTIMLAVSACSTPPYPRKLLSEIRAEEAAKQLSLQTQLPVPQPQVLETAAGPIDLVPSSALTEPETPAPEPKIASTEPAQSELVTEMAPGANPGAQETLGEESPTVVSATETTPAEGRMTVVADAVPPEVIADQPTARAWVDPDLTEEIREGETTTAPTARIAPAPVEFRAPEIVSSEVLGEAPPAPVTDAETTPDDGQMTVMADAVPPEVTADQPPARAWVDPDLTAEIHEADASTAAADTIEMATSESDSIETGAVETGPAMPDAAARLEPGFDIATLDPEANGPLDAAPLPERNPAKTDATMAKAAQADTTDADTTVAEEIQADLSAPPEENLEVAALVAAPSPSLVTEPATLPLPAPKAPALRREPKAAHKRRWSVPGEGGLIELEQKEAHRSPVRPSPSLTTQAVSAAAAPQTDETVVDTEDAARIADEQHRDQETSQALPSLPVAEVDRRSVVAVPSDAPQLASTTANLPRAIEPQAPLTGLQVPFAPGSSDLSDEARSSLAGLAEQLDVTSTPRLRLSAFSAAGDTANGQSRRLSLSRLFAVRNFLIEQGLRSEDIDLMPMAGTEDETPIDRVELEIDRT